MKKIVLLALVPMLLFFPGCKKVIRVDLNDASAKIVIEGNITNLPGPYQVKISKTVNFSADNVYPPVTGATVILSDSDAAVTETLTESPDGTYSAGSLVGNAGHTYQLSVNAEGQSYTASSVMPDPVVLDSVGFTEDLDFNNKKIIEAVLNFQDPIGIGNDYQFEQTINGKKLDRIFVFSDRLSDGKYIRQILYTDSAFLKVGDTLHMEMYCVDKNIYNYFFALDQLSNINGGQAATPANPDTNLSNGALGYFSAHTVFYRDLIVY